MSGRAFITTVHADLVNSIYRRNFYICTYAVVQARNWPSAAWFFSDLIVVIRHSFYKSCQWALENERITLPGWRSPDVTGLMNNASQLWGSNKVINSHLEIMIIYCTEKKKLYGQCRLRRVPPPWCCKFDVIDIDIRKNNHISFK